MKNIITKCLPALLIALGIFLCGLMIELGINHFAYRDRIVSVRGLAERQVEANKVTWPIVSKTVGNDLQEIYAQTQATNDAITSFLKKNGITDDEISVDAPQIVDLQADRYNNSAQPYRYNVTNVVVVTSSKVDKVRRLIEQQSQLLKQGIAIVAGDYNYQTTYEYTDLNAIKPDMIADATKNARQAAKKFAADSQSTLGKIRTASQGQFSIEDRDQYTPWIKNVRVVSTIEFYLED